MHLKAIQTPFHPIYLKASHLFLCPPPAASPLTAPQRNPSVCLVCVNCFLQASLNFSPLDNDFLYFTEMKFDMTEQRECEGH